MQADRNSFLVETTGPLDLVRNCFTDNMLGVASVATYDMELIASSNYQSNSTGQFCDFAAKFTTGMFYDSFSPICTNFDVTECQSNFSDAPSMSPSSSPIELSTLSPTVGESIHTVSTQKPSAKTSGAAGSKQPPVKEETSQAFADKRVCYAHYIACVLFTLVLR